MRTDTRKNIFEYISANKEVTVNQIKNHFGISAQIIHRHLNQLLNDQQIVKFGSSPRVFYRSNKLTPQREVPLEVVTDQKPIPVVAENYLYIAPDGRIYEPVDGFIEWCKKQNLDVVKTAGEYKKTLDKYNKFKKNGFIDGLAKLKDTFCKETYLDELYYLDFYSIERFGKTKLGALVLYAKQSQSKEYIKVIADLIYNDIKKLISLKNIDAIAMIPHTLPRKVQFMNELLKMLTLSLPEVKIVKVVNSIPIAQKTLNKLEDRIINAKNTIFINDTNQYNNVLILDDAIGSGATMNETAKKLKEKSIVKGKLIGLALTGSYKGFEVLNEV